MTFLSDILIYAAVITAVAAGKTDKKDVKPPVPPVFQSAQIKIGNNHVQAISSGNGGGVASVASVASRNGRVSSYSGVYSHPGLDAPIMISSNDATGITKTTSGKSGSMTITKEIDDKYSKGTIKISPGSVSVTSIAKSGSGPATGSNSFKYQQPAPFVPFSPFIQDPFFFHPIQMPQPRYDPWFPADKFKNMAQSRTSNVRPSWYYPAFNPYFNYWH